MTLIDSDPFKAYLPPVCSNIIYSYTGLHLKPDEADLGFQKLILESFRQFEPENYNLLCKHFLYPLNEKFDPAEPIEMYSSIKTAFLINEIHIKVWNETTATVAGTDYANKLLGEEYVSDVCSHLSAPIIPASKIIAMHNYQLKDLMLICEGIRDGKFVLNSFKGKQLSDIEKIFTIREWISKCKKIQITLSYKGLKELPSQLWSLNIDQLHANGNELTSLPLGIKKLPKITYINLSNNKFEKFPIPCEPDDSLTCVVKWKDNPGYGKWKTDLTRAESKHTLG